MTLNCGGRNELVCESDYPYCNDMGRCQRRKDSNYRGINREFNYKTPKIIWVLTIICIILCLYASFKITMYLIRSCKEGDLFSCFLLFRR
jgi:hypothetical protein